jgi:hypothetical protein
MFYGVGGKRRKGKHRKGKRRKKDKENVYIWKFSSSFFRRFPFRCFPFRRFPARPVLLLDQNERTGPFTMDLIAPHVALTQDRIDFDVNNLSLEKDYIRELGMRIDIAQRPYSIELEAIVANIKNKCFQTLRPIDAVLTKRIDKMTNIRGWKQIGPMLSVIPEPSLKCYVLLVPLPPLASLYAYISDKMTNIKEVDILLIEEIRNPFLEETYEGIKNF